MILSRAKAHECDPQLVESVQNLLTTLGFSPGKTDGAFGEITEKAVMDFQEWEGLYVDGIVGSSTMRGLEDAIARNAVETSSPGADAVDGTRERVPLKSVEADTFESPLDSRFYAKKGKKSGKAHLGLTTLYLRADAAKAQQDARKKLNGLGAKLTGGAGRRSIHTPPNNHRKECSFHYMGLAFDLHPLSGMQDPEKDPYVVVFDPKEIRAKELGDLRVYARTTGKSVPLQKLKGLFYEGDDRRRAEREVEGKFIDLTELLEEFGFKPIRSRPPFLHRSDRLAAEWWHFQFEKHLLPQVSTFGGELLKVYTEDSLRRLPLWQFRNRVFKLNWM